MKKILSIIGLSLLVVACGTTKGSLGNELVTNVNLGSKNFKVLNSVTGTATGRSVLGIGVNQKDLYNQAKKQMLTSANLEGGSKAIINVTVDESLRTGIFIIRKTVYISGQVVEFY